MIFVVEEPSLKHDLTEPAAQIDSEYVGFNPFFIETKGAQFVLDNHQSFEAQSSDYERRKMPPNDLFNLATRRQVIPEDSQTVARRLSELPAIQFPPVAQQPSKFLPAYQRVSAALGGNHGAIASYSVPQIESMKTQKDLIPTDQNLAQMQALVYENNPQLAKTGISQPGSTYFGHQTGGNPAAITACMHNHVASVTRSIDHAARAIRELKFLAKRIATLTDIEGAFVSEISSLLYDCLQFRQADSHRRKLIQNVLWLRVYVIGSAFGACLKEIRDCGHNPSGLTFCLYTTSMRLNNATVLYSRKWYAEKKDTRGLDFCAGSMLKIICKVLPTTNIVLYVSEDEQSALPPWAVDEFLQKRLVDGELPGFPGNYHWGLNQHLPAFPCLPEYTRISQGQLPELKDMSGRSDATATGREQPPSIPRTSEVLQSSWNAKTFKDSSYTGSDVTETEWTDWDMMFPGTQDGRSSISSRPPIAGISSSQYELLQSRSTPTIQKLVPAEGTVTGGTEVTLLGSGFYQGLEIMFGDIRATLTTFWGEKCLNCIVPPAAQLGSVKVRFRHEHHRIFLTQQESQSQTCVYKYIGDHEVEKQISGVVPESTSHGQLTAESAVTISTSSDSKMSPIMLTNLAILKYLAECLATLDVLSTRNDDIQEEVGRALISLRCALEKGPLDDDTILNAILLWSIEKIGNDQHTAERHWEGIKVLMRLHPDFEIGVPLGRICLLASLILTNQERNSLTEASKILRAAFRSTIENCMEIDDDEQSAAITSAPTPAATVYSPWSETDAEPPPYMLSPTPLKQACLIYAAVNARR